MNQTDENDPRLGRAEGQETVGSDHTVYIPQERPKSLPTAQKLIFYGHLRNCGLTHDEATCFAPVPYESELQQRLGRDLNWRDWLHCMTVSKLQEQAAHAEINELAKADGRIRPIHDSRPFDPMLLTTVNVEFHPKLNKQTGEMEEVNHDFRGYFTDLELQDDKSIIEHVGRAKGYDLFDPRTHGEGYLEDNLRDLRNWYCVSQFHQIFRDGPRGVWQRVHGRRVKVATSSVCGVICDKDKPHDIYGTESPTWDEMCEEMSETDSLLYTSKSNWKNPHNNRYRVILWFDYEQRDAAEWYPVLTWTYRNIYPCADHVIRNCVQAYTAGGPRTEVVRNHGGRRLSTVAVLTWLRYFHRRDSPESNSRRMTKFDREDDRYLMTVIREWQVGVHDDERKRERRFKRNARKAKETARKIKALLKYNPHALEEGFNEWIPPSCGVPRMTIVKMSEKAMTEWAERSPNHARHNVLFGIALKLFRDLPDPYVVATAMMRCSPIRSYVCGPEYDPSRFATDVANAWDRYVRSMADPALAADDAGGFLYVTGETATHERKGMPKVVIRPEALEPLPPRLIELVLRHESTFGRPYSPLMRQTLQIVYHWYLHGPDHAVLPRGAGTGKSTAYLLLSVAFPEIPMVIVKPTVEDVRECIKQHISMGFPADQIAGYEAYDSDQCLHTEMQVFDSGHWGQIQVQQTRVCRRCERNREDMLPHERCPMGYAKTDPKRWKSLKRLVVTRKKWQLLMERGRHPKCLILGDEAINPVETCRISCILFQRFAGLIPKLQDGRLEEYMRRLGIPKEMLQTPVKITTAVAEQRERIGTADVDWEAIIPQLARRDRPEPEVCNVIDRSPGLTEEECRAARKALRDSYRKQLTLTGGLALETPDGKVQSPKNDKVRESYFAERDKLAEFLRVMRQIPGEEYRQVATRGGNLIIQRRSSCLQRPTRMLIADATARENPVAIPGYALLHVPGVDADATGLRLVIERANATKKNLRNEENRRSWIKTLESLVALPEVKHVHHITTADPKRDHIDVDAVKKIVESAGKKYKPQSVGRMVGSNDGAFADLVIHDSSNFPGVEEIALRYGWDTGQEIPYGQMWRHVPDKNEETGEILSERTFLRFRCGFEEALPEAYRIATAVQQSVQALMRGRSRHHTGQTQYGLVRVSNLQEEEALMAALPGAVKFKPDRSPEQTPEQLRTMPANAIRLLTTTEMLRIMDLEDVPTYRREMPAVRMRAYLAALENEINAASIAGVSRSTAADYAAYARRDIERDLILTLCYDPESLMVTNDDEERQSDADGNADAAEVLVILGSPSENGDNSEMPSEYCTETETRTVMLLCNGESS